MTNEIPKSPSDKVDQELSDRPSRQELIDQGLDVHVGSVKMNKMRRKLSKNILKDSIDTDLTNRPEMLVALENVGVAPLEYEKLSKSMAPKVANLDPKIKRNTVDKELSTRRSKAYYSEKNIIPRSTVFIPEGLPGWVKSQLKTFVRWANLRLSRSGFSNIYDVTTEFADGQKLAELLNSTLSTPLPPFCRQANKKHTNEKLRAIYNLDRMGQVFDIMRKALPSLSSIKEVDIVEGELKHKLSLIWRIILTYNEKNLSEEDINLEKSIIIWINKIIKEKQYEGLTKFKKINKDLRNGLVLTAMADYFDSEEAISYDKVYGDFKSKKENNRQRIERALRFAESKFGVPALIDAEDIDVDEPDSKALITYLSEWISVFTRNARLKQAVGIIQEFIRLQMKLEKLHSVYLLQAEGFLDFCSEKIRYFNEVAKVGDKLPETRENLRQFEIYYTNEKNVQQVKLIKLSSIYLELATMAKTNGRKMPKLDTEYLPESLENQSHALTSAENSYSKRLNEKMKSYFSNKESNSAEITPEMEADIENTFDVFDAAKLGYIDELKFRSALQAVGLVPDNKAWRDIVKMESNDEENKKTKRGINKKTFVGYCKERLSLKNDAKGVVEAFNMVSHSKNGKNIAMADLSGNLEEKEIEFLKDKMMGQNNDMTYDGYVQGSFEKE